MLALKPTLRRLRRVRIIVDILEFARPLRSEWRGDGVWEVLRWWRSGGLEVRRHCGPSVSAAADPQDIASFPSNICLLKYALSMITRRTPACIRLIRQIPSRRCRHGSFQRRKASTASTTPTTPPSAASPLASITSELDKISPRFDVSASSIEILRGPPEFYETLKVLSQNTGLRIAS